MGVPNLNVPVQANSNAVITVLDTRFKAGFDKAQTDVWSNQVADQQNYGRGKTIVVPWREPARRYSRFLGEFVAHPWIVDAIQTTSEPWMSAVMMDRDEIIENVIMDYGDAAQGLGVQSAKLPDDLTALALRTQGSSSATPFTWYDGKAAFAEDHPIDPRGYVSGTWRNLFKGLPLTQANVVSVWSQLANGVKLPNGRHMQVRPNKLGVSPKWELLARKICSDDMMIEAIASLLAPNGAFGATGNNLKGMLTPVVMPELDQTIEGIPGEPDVWYLWDDRYMKPITIYWIRRPIVIPVVNDADMRVNELNSYAYVGRAHGAALITAPWIIGRVEPGIGP